MEDVLIKTRTYNILTTPLTIKIRTEVKLRYQTSKM